MPIVFWDPETEALYADSLLVSRTGRVMTRARQTFFVDDKDPNKAPGLLAVIREAGAIDSVHPVYAAFCKGRLRDAWKELPQSKQRMLAMVVRNASEMSLYVGGEDYQKTTVSELDSPWAIGSGADIARAMLRSGNNWRETMEAVKDQDVYSGGATIQAKRNNSRTSFVVKEIV